MMNLHIADIVVLILYFVATMGIGFFFSRKNTNTEEYFLGGRSFPGWALGLSLVGTCMSSVTFIAYPADGFKTTLVRLTLILTFPLVALFSAYVLLPFFRRGTVTSAMNTWLCGSENLFHVTLRGSFSSFRFCGSAASSIWSR